MTSGNITTDNIIRFGLVALIVVYRAVHQRFTLGRYHCDIRVPGIFLVIR